MNHSFSLISNHCMGGFVYHDLGLRFLSPTINLKILPDDFIVMLEDLEYYMTQPVELADCENSPCPVGRIPIRGTFDQYVYIHFVHYNSFNEGKNKWEERAKRINWDNIVVMMTARDGCKYSTLERFENLPIKQKICYTLSDYPEFPHCHYARLDDGNRLNGYISDIINIWGKRAFECNGFDLVDFLNRNVR